MTDSRGTPKNFREMIRHAAMDCHVELNDKHVEEFATHLKEKLAQRFAVAMLCLEGDAYDALEKLWESLKRDL